MYDLIIIGAGPTGISIAIEAQKKGLSYLILEKGKLVNSIYNFPSNMTFFSTSLNLEIGGIPFISHNDKPTRTEALEYYRRLTSHYDLKIRYRVCVNSIQRVNDNFRVNGDVELVCKNIVVATGFYDHYRKLNIPGEELSKVKHYYDDPHPYVGMNVLVIGAANSACDVALETWQNGANVTMVIRQDQLYPKVKYWILPNIRNRIKEGSIKAFFNSNVKSISADNVIIDTPDGTIELDNDYVLAMTGYVPNFDFIKEIGIHLDNDDNQKPIINPETLETNVKNIYVAGVVVSGLSTSELFIENTRHHGELIVKDILSKN
jgi:thioredoxin reductase (NADPH)